MNGKYKLYDNRREKLKWIYGGEFALATRSSACGVSHMPHLDQTQQRSHMQIRLGLSLRVPFARGSCLAFMVAFDMMISFQGHRNQPNSISHNNASSSSDLSFGLCISY